MTMEVNMKQMTALEVLRKTRDLLSIPEAWTKDAFGRTKLDISWTPSHPKAVKWCLEGAVNKVVGADGICYQIPHAAKAMMFLRMNVPAPFKPDSNVVLNFNDDRDTTYSDVLALLDRAIAEAEAEAEAVA